MSTQEYDLTDDAPRYVVEALAAIREKDPKRTADVYDLADAWVLPRPSNYIDLRVQYADEVDEKRSEVDEYSVKEWLVEAAIGDVIANNGGDYESVIIQEKGEYRLDEDVDISTLQLHGEPLFPKTVPLDLFTPGGKWANNSRTYDPAKLGTLRESMKAIGWPKHLPAIGDKRTKDSDTPIIIVGHRRIEVAEQLGIEPNIEWVDFGEGPAAEATKIALAIASNTGGENISPADRKKIAQDLYGSDKFSQEEIANLLNVSVMTVSRDLRGLTDVKPHPERGGRPRKKPTPPPEPTPPAPPKLTVVPGEATVEAAPTAMGERVAASLSPGLAGIEPAPAETKPVDHDVEGDVKEMLPQLNERIEKLGSAIIGPMLTQIATGLDGIADYVTRLDYDGQIKLLTEHHEVLMNVRDNWQRTVTVLKAAEEKRFAAKQPADEAVSGAGEHAVVADEVHDDANVERVAQGILRGLKKRGGAAKTGEIRTNCVQGKDRKYFGPALDRLVQAGSVVVTDDGIKAPAAQQAPMVSPSVGVSAASAR